MFEMNGNFHESYSAQEAPPPPEKSTGLVFAAVLAIIAGFNWDRPLGVALISATSVGLVSVSFFAPFILKPLNRVWFRFSMLLSKVMNPLIMALMFAITIIPFGLVMRLWRDPLQLKSRGHKKSYWITCNPEERLTSSMKNQF